MPVDDFDFSGDSGALAEQPSQVIDKPCLSTRECEVLTWAARGKSAWETAEILGITTRTVNKHTQTAFRKLRAANRTHAVALALQQNLIEP